MHLQAGSRRSEKGGHNGLWFMQVANDCDIVLVGPQHRFKTKYDGYIQIMR